MTLQGGDYVRSLEPDPEKSKELITKLGIYPFGQRDNPPKTKLLLPEGKPWNQGQPRGLDYWKRLHAIIQEEPAGWQEDFSGLTFLGLSETR